MVLHKINNAFRFINAAMNGGVPWPIRNTPVFKYKTFLSMGNIRNYHFPVEFTRLNLSFSNKLSPIVHSTVGIRLSVLVFAARPRVGG